MKPREIGSPFWDRISDWLDRHEIRVLMAFLLGYAILIFVVHGEFRVNGDSPAYADASINYLDGKGFTSTCWYAQRADEFWAGNVPLYEFFLIPWFKITGASWKASLLLNFLYVLGGTILIWRSLQRSNFVRTSLWRLGAVMFFLLSDCAYYLVTQGRPEPLLYLLVSLAAYLLTVRNSYWRFLGLFAVACATPWTSLTAAAYTGVLGVAIIAFYPARFWREVVVFAIGGVTGAVTLYLFYNYHHVWNSFVQSVSPHLAGGAPALKFHSTGGLTQTFELPYLAGAILMFLAFRFLRGRSWKLPLFAVVCGVLVLTAFLKGGVFPGYYGWYLHFLLAVFLFAILSDEPVLQRFRWVCVVGLIVTSVVVPGSFVRRTIKSRLHVEQDRNSERQILAFLRRVLRPGDVAMVDPMLYYEAKPLVRQLYSGVTFVPEFRPKEGIPERRPDLAAINVWVWQRDADAPFPGSGVLPGNWETDSEAANAWDGNFVVSRRVDLTQPHTPDQTPQ